MHAKKNELIFFSGNFNSGNNDTNDNNDNENSTSLDSCHIVKLRGLPWNVSVEDIFEFLKGVEVLRQDNGVHLITSPRDGRPNGEAFVECASEDDFNKAFDYHKKVMGHRYIESKEFNEICLVFINWIFVLISFQCKA